MRKTVVAIAALLLVANGPTWAQATNAKPDAAAEAKAAMERAQRLAANPMKVILQASKIRRKTEAEPVAEAPDANLRRAAVRSADAAAVPLTRSLAAAPAATTAAVTALAAPPLSPPAPPAPARAEEAQPKLMPASLGLASLASDLPALGAATAVVEAAPAIAKAVAPQAVPVLPALATPTLVSIVEPDIPVRLLSVPGRVNEVMADLTLRPDGSVGAVALVSLVPRNWKPYITAALEQWRFEPLPSARVHRVQLVFEER